MNKAIKWRASVAGMFAHDDADLRRVGAIPAVQHEEWTLDRRYLTMDRAVIVDLERPVTVELEAARHESHRRLPHRNSPLEGTLPYCRDEDTHHCRTLRSEFHCVSR